MDFVKIFAKVASSSLLLTIFNYSVNIYGLRALESEAIGFIIFTQSFLAIGLQIGLNGINYEILRFGSEKNFKKGTYRISKNDLIWSLATSFLYFFGSLFFLDTIDSASGYIFLLLPTVTLVVFVYLSSSILRSLGRYVLSNLVDKFIATSTSSVIVIAVLFDLNEWGILLVYLINSILALLASILLIKKRIFLDFLLKRSSNQESRNFRYNLYYASLMILVVLELQNVFIAEKISFQQLALFNAYFLLFFPFKFLARNLHQILFAEIAQDRIFLSWKLYGKYIAICLLVSLVVFIIGQFPLKEYYALRFDLNTSSIAAVALMGFFYLSYGPIGTLIGSKGSNRSILYSNIWGTFLSLTIIGYYIYYLDVNFPDLLIWVFVIFWFLKSFFGIILTRNMVTSQ